MSLAPKLVVIEGGLAAEEPPVIPPARDTDRIYLPATPTRPGDFAHFVAVSLTLHAAIVAGCIAWNLFGEERASGGTEELVVIEGVNVVMLDQLESTPSPLAEAAEIETSDEAAPVEETELAAVAPTEMAPPAEDVAETPPEAAAEARPPAEARVVPDEAVEPAPEAEAEAATPAAEDEPAAEAEDLAVSADATATPVGRARSPLPKSFPPKRLRRPSKTGLPLPCRRRSGRSRSLTRRQSRTSRRSRPRRRRPKLHATMSRSLWSRIRSSRPSPRRRWPRRRNRW
jgi:hypothetical protein